MKDKNQNFYKYTTYVLLAIIVIVGLVYFITWYNQGIYTNGVVDGQNQAVNIILSNIINSGSAQIQLDANTSVVLVPVQSVQAAQAQILTTVAQTAITDGFVTITIGEDEVVLVPYNPPQQSN